MITQRHLPIGLSMGGLVPGVGELLATATNDRSGIVVGLPPEVNNMLPGVRCDVIVSQTYPETLSGLNISVVRKDGEPIRFVTPRRDKIGVRTVFGPVGSLEFQVAGEPSFFLVPEDASITMPEEELALVKYVREFALGIVASQSAKFSPRVYS